MSVIKGKKNNAADIREISFLYDRLHILFGEIAQATLRWSVKQAGVVIESEKSHTEQAKFALRGINKVLRKLIAVDHEFKFDKRVLEERYRDEMAFCQIVVEGMSCSVDCFWKYGKPSHREAPFGDATSYKFIASRLVLYMDQANEISKSLNSKAERFNKVNSDLPPLPVLKTMSAPSWARML